MVTFCETWKIKLVLSIPGILFLFKTYFCNKMNLIDKFLQFSTLSDILTYNFIYKHVQCFNKINYFPKSRNNKNLACY